MFTNVRRSTMLPMCFYIVPWSNRSSVSTSLTNGNDAVTVEMHHSHFCIASCSLVLAPTALLRRTPLLAICCRKLLKFFPAAVSCSLIHTQEYGEKREASVRQWFGESVGFPGLSWLENTVHWKCPRLSSLGMGACFFCCCSSSLPSRIFNGSKGNLKNAYRSSLFTSFAAGKRLQWSLTQEF